MRIAILPVALSLALAVPGRAAAAPVKVGFVNSVTGPEAPIGEALTNGVDLAMDDLKKKGVESSSSARTTAASPRSR